MTDQLARIAEKVGHRWRQLAPAGRRTPLNPPLRASAMATFEEHHEVSLPEGYRRFVLELGDGGFGPGYGLLTLEHATTMWVDEYPGHLAEPSPFKPGRSYPENWWDVFSGEDERPHPLQGSLSIVSRGCSDITLLVVSGPGRGLLVEANADGFGMPYVHKDPDFLTWYERWLDDETGPTRAGPARTS